MAAKIGMRISPKILQEGIDKAAKWAVSAGMDILDLPKLEEAEYQACLQAGIEIGTTDADWGAVSRMLGRDESKRRAAVDTLKTQIKEIAHHGGKLMFMCLVPEVHDVPRKETYAIWREAFPEIVRTAEQEGVYIAFEGWPGPSPYHPAIGCTPEMWRAMFKDIPSSHFGMTYDPSHLIRIGIDYLRALDEFAERVVHCHGKDTEIMQESLYERGWLGASFDKEYMISDGVWRYTIPGEGSADWNKVASGLRKVNYQGAVCIELEDDKYWGSLEAEQRGMLHAKDYLRTIFG